VRCHIARRVSRARRSRGGYFGELAGLVGVVVRVVFEVGGELLGALEEQAQLFVVWRALAGSSERASVFDWHGRLLAGRAGDGGGLVRAYVLVPVYVKLSGLVLSPAGI
jgi:hypothetical protein